MIGKIFFAILMGFGVFVAIAAGMYSMAFFFAIVCAITVWFIKTRPKEPMPK